MPSTDARKVPGRCSALIPGGRVIRLSDRRVQDDAVEINGGLMLVIGYVPDSEREYIQFLGRTARQDKRGQFCAVLLNSDYDSALTAGAEATGASGDDQTGVVRTRP